VTSKLLGNGELQVNWNPKAPTRMKEKYKDEDCVKNKVREPGCKSITSCG